MPSQVTSGSILNEMRTIYPREPNTVLSSPFNHITAVRNHNTELLVNEDTHLNNILPSSCSQTDASSIAQMSFDRMTLNDLLSIDANYEFPPTSNEFRVILFNDALKSGLFEFKAGVVHDAKAALLSSSSPSYKHLSSLVVSLAQSEKALNRVKQDGLISEGEFRNVRNQLKNYAIMLSDIGNAYHSELIKRPGEDIHHAYLVVKSHKRGNFTKLYKRIANIDREVKSLLNGYPEVKSTVSQQMNRSVCQFINHYFQPEAPTNTENWRELGQYIKENAMDKITALFKNDARNRPGHLFNAGGSEHLYDCYSEIFDHFKTRQEVDREQHASSSAPKDALAGSKEISGNGINNNFSPVFNPINSPNFFNNINDSLLDKLDSNNRLLAEILEKMTSKQGRDQETQTESTAHYNEGADPIPTSFGQTVATQTSVSDPIVSNSKSIQTPVQPSDRRSSNVLDNGSQTVLPKPASWTRLVDSIRHVTVISNDTQPTTMSQMAKPYVSSSKYRVAYENERQNVKLRPTKTRDPMTFEVNRGYRERAYYEDNGKVSSGFVRDRRAAYEETILESNVDIPRSEDQALESTSERVADDRVIRKENRVTPESEFVTDRGARFESDIPVSPQDELVFLDAAQQIVSAKPILTAIRAQQQLDADDFPSPGIMALASIPREESDLLFQDASELTQIEAREIKRAEKVQNNHAFLAHLRSEKGIKVM